MDPPRLLLLSCAVFVKIWLASSYCYSSCENGGFCVSGKCVCNSDYYGSNCQYENGCNDRCQNGGTCYEGSCSCGFEYYGEHCQLRYNRHDYSSSSSSHSVGGIIAGSTFGGLFFCGCIILVVFLRVWLRVRRSRRLANQANNRVPCAGQNLNGRRVVLVSCTTTSVPVRPPGAPPPYMPTNPDPRATPTGNGGLPLPPYAGPSYPYSGPPPPATGGYAHQGSLPQYTGPAPYYGGSNPQVPQTTGSNQLQADQSSTVNPPPQQAPTGLNQMEDSADLDVGNDQDNVPLLGE